MFEVWRCENCEHRFINPQPEDATLMKCYSSQYHAYEQGHGTGELHQAIEQARREKRFRHVDLRNDMDVLDVGCGSGSFLCVIREFVSSVFGIEPSEHGVKTCEKLGVPVFHGDFESYDRQANRKFDLITLNHVLEHHPAPILLLRLCRQHLKEGGRVWIAVPNAGCFFAKHLESDWHSADLPVHLQQFSVRSLGLAVEKAGLKIEQSLTESENSLPASASTFLRRFGIPGRVTRPLLRGALSKTGWIGRRVDASGNGEAIILSAQV
ncbi:class I SAM-dependent methyltransferase [Litoreibacter ponti]|uniref:class I SAM-dependent methyltransferase n=1 Tax=Litoreibacter ponti TaxID=1510457 RepID=UPI001304DE48|nr:class I SAM-dependent methyltransferase [Litoreibacter ponti]